VKVWHHPTIRARARAVHRRGVMNKTEEDYAAHLKLRMHIGEVIWFAYEGLRLRLADNTFYCPDFPVQLACGEIEMHETKGYWEETARAKIKIAAQLFPFRFVGVTRAKGGGWEFENF
jgi:hypothetical protein